MLFMQWIVYSLLSPYVAGDPHDARHKADKVMEGQFNAAATGILVFCFLKMQVHAVLL